MQILAISFSILTGFSSFYFFKKENYRYAILLLFVAALILRIVMTTLDPFLNEWDERFHAIVAKNMMKYPFQPMLRIDAIQPYDFKAWDRNHIWLHKQPLFLWQMALSMKIFGVSEVSLRLPSAIMGAILVLPTYRIAAILIDKKVGYYAAFLICFAFYQLELIAGAIAVEHNDMAFLFYTTMSMWAFAEYSLTQNRKWIYLIGLFAGAAILCKWLTGFWVFSVWGIWIITQSDKRKELKSYIDYGISVALTCLIFMPWQIYTAIYFPTESSYERGYNSMHIWKAVEGHSGKWYYYLDQINNHFGNGFALIFFVTLLLFIIAAIPKQSKISFLTAIVVPYFFFSIIVQTKMPSYVYFTSALLYILLAYFIYTLLQFFSRYKYLLYVEIVFLLFFTFWGFRPDIILNYHLYNEPYECLSFNMREQKIYNTQIYKELDKLVPQDYVIFNAKFREDTEAMFYSRHNVYFGCMSLEEYQKHKQNGVKIAAFKDHNNQNLPEFLKNDPDVLIIDRVLH